MPTSDRSTRPSCAGEADSLQAAGNPDAPDLAQMRRNFPRGVSMPALRALASAGFGDLDALDGASEAQLRSLHGMGPKAIGVLREALGSRGKAFRQ